ncbi:MAG: hypothetical protein PHU23_01595 [Dehalococcoidales bacterium]|nr:hypothetical protein [Dehalococcoidales bacterium]
MNNITEINAQSPSTAVSPLATLPAGSTVEVLGGGEQGNCILNHRVEVFLIFKSGKPASSLSNPEIRRPILILKDCRASTCREPGKSIVPAMVFYFYGFDVINCLLSFWQIN